MNNDIEDAVRYLVENNGNETLVSGFITIIRQREESRAEVKALKEEIEALREREQSLERRFERDAGSINYYRQWVERLIVENNDMAEAIARAGRKYIPLANPNRTTLRK